MYPLIAKGSIIFLIGDRGPGKTQIGTWIASQRIMDGAGAGVYRKALDLWGEIRATWRQGSEKTEDDVERRYKRAEFLVVDEAQERGDTEGDRQWCDRMFTHILDHRYDGMLPTLLIANLNPEGYEATIPASIRSRVAECGGVKHCDWPSYRTA
jgi:DNA replication protein DnaC